MSAIASEALGLLEDLWEESNYRVLCDDERDALLQAERVLARLLSADHDAQREAKAKEAA